MAEETMLAKMMGGFGDADSAVTAEVTQFSTTPYVVFAQPKAVEAFNKLREVAPRVKDGDPFLMVPNAKPVELSPLRYFLVAASQYWAKENTVGKALFTEFDADRVTDDLREYIDTVVILQLDESLKPGLAIARCCFKATKVPGVNPALNALKKARTPDWLEMSAAHAATASIPDPRFRFVTEVRMVDRVSQGAEPRPYVTCEAFVEPTSKEEIQELLQYFELEEAQKQQVLVKESFDKRIASMRAMQRK